jgi:hypothetical protein
VQRLETDRAFGVLSSHNGLDGQAHGR